MTIPSYGGAIPPDLYQSLNNPNPYATFGPESNPYYAQSYNANNALLQGAGINTYAPGAANINSAADALLFASGGAIARGYGSGLTGGFNMPGMSGSLTGGVNPFGNWASSGLGDVFGSVNSWCGRADAFVAQNAATVQYGRMQKQQYYDGQMAQAMQVTALRQQYMAQGFSAQQVTNIIKTGSPYTPQQTQSSGAGYSSNGANTSTGYDDDAFWNYIMSKGKSNNTATQASAGNNLASTDINQFFNLLKSVDTDQLAAMLKQILGS